MSDNNEAVKQAIEVISREIERLQQLKAKLEVRVLGKPVGDGKQENAAETSTVAESATQFGTVIPPADEPVIPLREGGKRIPQKVRIQRLLVARGPLVRGEVAQMLKIPHHTLNACLSDRKWFRVDSSTHKWYLAGHNWNGTAWRTAKEGPSTDIGTEQDPA